ncbi:MULTISPECIES: amidohydrolase [unclassified Novosphingobium]|uniref:amidohydrolase n=1 Tax=unclassified Novosphingobium TaxID=2644732 RepID=UPI001357D85F|nr:MULTISPECIES: amidohydrolase [unclassified Novosphingobium]
MFSRRQMLLGAGAAALTPALIGRAAFARPDMLDVAYVNGRIWTGISAVPFTDAIGVSGNRIAAVGKAAVRAETKRSTHIVDLEGAFVAPGFVDNHAHMVLGSMMLVQVPLLPVRTPQQLIDAVGGAVRKVKPGGWVQGFGWDEQRWGGELPNKAWLDGVSADVPVALRRTDGHQMIVNSRALQLAGITRDTPNPPGGVILRDDKGEPTGILRDNALNILEHAIPAPSDAEIDDALQLGIKEGLSHGVTQVHGTDLDWLAFDGFRRLRARGEPGMRFYSFVPLRDWEKLAALVKEEGRGDDWCRWGGLKHLADGSLGSRTALFAEPYIDNPANRGLATTPFDEVHRWVHGADAAGLQVACHAIGDEAIRRILDIYEAVAAANGARDRRFRIEHAQHLNDAEAPRIAAQGVIASMQPYHAADDGRWAETAIGHGRLHGSWAFRSLLDAGATVTFGSDWPVAPLDPMTGIHAAVTRATTDGKQPGGFVPEQKITVAESLVAYTRSNAYAGFQEDRLGTIKPGNLADFVVLGNDPLTTNPDDLAGIKVRRTIVGGKERFVAE